MGRPPPALVGVAWTFGLGTLKPWASSSIQTEVPHPLEGAMRSRYPQHPLDHLRVYRSEPIEYRFLSKIAAWMVD